MIREWESLFAEMSRSSAPNVSTSPNNPNDIHSTDDKFGDVAYDSEEIQIFPSEC